MRKRMSSDPEEGVKYFGRFTWKDLVRLGLPITVPAWLTVGQPASMMVGAVLVGGVLGVVWAGVQPYGKPLEVHCYHRIRWLLFRGEDR